MACRDCEEKAAGALDFEERLRLIEHNETWSAVLITILAAAVYVLWNKAFKE